MFFFASFTRFSSSPTIGACSWEGLGEKNSLPALLCNVSLPHPKCASGAPCLSQTRPTSSTGGSAALSIGLHLPVHVPLSPSTRPLRRPCSPVLPYNPHRTKAGGSACRSRAHRDPVRKTYPRLLTQRASRCRSQLRRKRRPAWHGKRWYNYSILQLLPERLEMCALACTTATCCAGRALYTPPHHGRLPRIPCL